MPRHAHGFALALAAAVLAVWAAALTIVAAPPPDGGRLIALFAPGSPDSEAYAAIVRAGAWPVGRTAGGMVWTVESGPGAADRLKAQGAVAVLRELPFAPALGCGGGVVVAGRQG